MALGKIDPNLEDCARTLGAPWWKVFLRVTLPLSVPGLVAGFTLVFSLTAGYSMHVPKPVDPEELTTIIASLAARPPRTSVP